VITSSLLMMASLAMGLISAALALVVIVTRVARFAAGSAREARLAPHRLALLAIAAGGDEDGEAAARLRAVQGRDWPPVRGLAVSLLGKVRGEPAEQLARLLDARGEFRRARSAVRSRRAIVRERAAWLLGFSRTPEDTVLLLPLLTDRSAAVRLAAARSLGSLGDAAAAAPLLAAVQPVHGRPGIPAAVAAEALLSFGTGAVTAVSSGLADNDPTVRAVAAMVAAEESLSAVAPQLRSLLADEPVLEVRVPVAQALGVAGGPEDVAGLAAQTAITQPPAMRRAAAQALGELGHPGAVLVLAGLLPDHDVRLARYAGDALVRIGPTGMRELQRALAGNGQAARVAAGSLGMARLQGNRSLPVGVPLASARDGSP
jgi:HEAT repeat protein